MLNITPMFGKSATFHFALAALYSDGRGISYYGLSLDATSGGGEHAKCRKTEALYIALIIKYLATNP